MSAEGGFERLGTSQTRRVDVRVIAATHRHLDCEAGQPRFRMDLYYRFGVFPVHLPPLRAPTADIPALVSHFLRQAERRIDRQPLVPAPLLQHRGQVAGPARVAGPLGVPPSTLGSKIRRLQIDTVTFRRSQR